LNPEDLTPGPQASLPGMEGWSESEVDRLAGPQAVFSTNPPGRAATELPSIGQIGRYALKYRIGEGGLGTVYAAHDPVLARLVAIKTVHVQTAAADREAFSALFLNEARAAAALSHPHIVTVFDAGIDDAGGAYIAMELLKGLDLRQLRQEGWQPTPTQAAQIAQHVAEALAYAHAHGVVHRDIKPANIFMVGRTQPRVLDFGIARVARRMEDTAEQELSGGSPYYMAPEQVLQQPVDGRADLFSLGVVLYELLTGTRPFEGHSLAQITRAVLEKRVTAVDEVNPAAPKPLARIVARALAKDPQGRYPSAAAMARDLRDWLEMREGSPTVAAPQPRRAPRLPRRIGIALGVAALVAGGAWLAAPPRTTAQQAIAPAAPTKGLVQIDASPWAQVEVDGISVGTAPPLNQLALPEGRHTITLRHGDAEPFSVTIDVAVGKPAVVAHRFSP